MFVARPCAKVDRNALGCGAPTHKLRGASHSASGAFMRRGPMGASRLNSGGCANCHRPGPLGATLVTNHRACHAGTSATDASDVSRGVALPTAVCNPKRQQTAIPGPIAPARAGALFANARGGRKHPRPNRAHQTKRPRPHGARIWTTAGSPARDMARTLLAAGARRRPLGLLGGCAGPGL